jgi:protein-L-isoaspartate(D-aspartate) O-methyltransferase
MNSNSELVQHLILEKVLQTENVIDAFKTVDRKDFVLPEDQDKIYQDRALAVGYGATISQPTTVAIMLEKLKVQEEDKILEIGTGSGYLTALLAKIAGENGRVFSIEYVSELKKLAQANLKKYNFRNVSLFVGDGRLGLKDYTSFDRIISSASGNEIPRPWKDQLKIKGRIVAPVGDNLVVLEKLSKRKFKEEKIAGFIFVPLK